LGAESLGAHIEGPFLSPTKNGIHNVAVLRGAANGFSDLEECYGADNLKNAKMLTAAPEQGILQAIPQIVEKGIVYSIGHSEASYEEASEAVAAGATMITHLFNAMRPLHHRNPGIFGVLGSNGIKSSSASPSSPPTTPRSARSSSDTTRLSTAIPSRPFFGLIADGIHLHPTSVKIAYSAHPSGCILVTDAMHLVGLPDGLYSWGSSGEERIVKTGPRLTLEGSDILAGSAISLIECVNNFMQWTGAGIARSLGTVTGTPARVLGLQEKKGSLEVGADADLVVLSEVIGEEGVELVVDEVWKFGERVWER
jgi:N-acetylglucosamine-6-phosphate deacetylase